MSSGSATGSKELPLRKYTSTPLRHGLKYTTRLESADQTSFASFSYELPVHSSSCTTFYDFLSMMLIFSSARAKRSANLPSGEVHLISAAAWRTMGKSAKASTNHLTLFMI